MSRRARLAAVLRGADGRAQCQGSTEGGPGYAVRLGK